METPNIIPDKHLNRRRRWPWLLVLLLVLLLGALRVAVRSDMVLDWVRQQAIHTADASLNGSIHIETLTGDLLRGVTASGIHIWDENGHRIVQIDSLRVRYRLWSFWSEAFQIDEIAVFSPEVDIEQFADGGWNLRDLFLATPDESEAVGSESVALDMPSVQLFDGVVRIQSPALPSDSVVSVQEWMMDTGISLRADGARIQLRSVSLALYEGRLDGAVQVDASASVDPERITLERLTVSTAASLMEAWAALSTDGSAISAQARWSPLSWRDVLAYSGDPYFVQDLQVGVELGGQWSAAEVSITLQAQGMDSLSIRVLGSVSDELTISSVSVTSGHLDLPRLTGDADLPVVGSMRMMANGTYRIGYPQLADISVEGSVSQVEVYPYRLDRADMYATLASGAVSARFTADRLRGQVRATFEADAIFDTAPAWQATVQSTDFNPAVWLSDPALDARLNLALAISAHAFTPAEQPWILTLTAGGRWNEQSFEQLTTNLQLTASELTATAALSVRESQIRFRTDITDWSTDRPAYTYTLNTEALNLSELTQFANFPTRIHARLEGTGEGRDPETLRTSAILDIRNSIVNGAELDSLQGRIRLENNILRIDETVLRSTLATGNLTLRQKLIDPADPDNRLQFLFTLGNLQPLAPLAGLEFLQAKGNLSGEMRTNSYGSPEVHLQLALADIVIDTVFISSLDATTRVHSLDAPVFAADVRLREVTSTKTLINDLWLVTEGSHANSLLAGSYRLESTFFDHFTVYAQGEYRSASHETTLYTHTLRLRESDNRYVLENPFTARLRDERFHLEPVSLMGLSGVRLLVQAEQYGPDSWRGRLHTAQADLTVVQRMFADPMPVAGTLNLDVDFDLNTSSNQVNLQSRLHINSFSVHQFQMDTLRVSLDIQNNRLLARVDSWRGGQSFLVARADIPFNSGNPADFDTSFFEEPVRGSLSMRPLLLESEPALLRALQLDGLQGRLQFSANLDGTAGSPEMDFRTDFLRGRFSGVPVDSLGFVLAFSQAEQVVTVQSDLISGGQEAASLRGTVPLSVDWQNFTMQMPTESNPNDIRLVTTGLNLASFNQFADRAIVRAIAGRVSADIRLRGSFDKPQLTGFLSLQNAGAHLVQTNATYSNGQLDARFTRDRITVEQMELQSHGNFSGSGEVRLDRFIPAEVDLTLRANGFRVSDTRDVQAFIGLDARIHGDFAAPKMTGSVALDRGFIYLDNFGERDVETVILDEDASADTLEVDLWENLTMELRIATDRNFFVRNRARPEINLQLRGELDLLKDPGEDVQVFGTIGASDGYVTQLGKRFMVERGDLTFSGPPGNPALQIRALYALRQPSDIQIWYNIRGTAMEPEFVYESDPEMELPDMISYTLFGRPANALMSWEQGIAGRSEGSVSDVAVDVLLDRVEQLATERLGIDVLQIDNTRSSGNSGTTIKAGKFISDRLFVAILQELGSNVSSQVMLEYELRRNLDVVVTGSDNYQTGIDIMWRRDY